MQQEESNILEGLNEAQKEAVTCLNGPSLIIAGAGSGKTKVLTCKVANILAHSVFPSSVLVLTFTNKASGEMKERIENMVGHRAARGVWMGTFHSIFLRFLRRYSELLGYPPSFTIYDRSDSVSLINRCIKELQIEDKAYKGSEICSRISECKNNFITPENYTSRQDYMDRDYRSHRPRLHEIYSLYQKLCEQQGVMDFDDILLNTYKLLSKFPEAFEQIRGRFEYILVDEYQDTNYLQYVILKGLASSHHNITVVGDDSQSIYAFRGARIENILNFSKDYPEASVFRLERNYRSTKNIVEAANSLINKNTSKLAKTCYSEGEQGEKIEIINSYTDKEEALLVASSIAKQKYAEGAQYKDFAILYRTNAQSRLLEEALRKKNMPYKIYAGHSFYERAEIKSMIAYLRLIVNPLDDEAFKRVVNFPPRGIGAISMERLIGAALERNCSICSLVKSATAEELNVKVPTFSKLQGFVAIIDELGEEAKNADAFAVAAALDLKLGIIAALRNDTTLEGQGRVENIEALFNSIKEFVDEGAAEGEADGEPAPLITLDLYLQNVALISDSDKAVSSSELSKPTDEEVEANNNRISLMTVHAAKGLEFPYVYVVGMEESLFPSGGAVGSVSVQDIEEERRLFYVALTRAEKSVKLSWAHSRMKWGTYNNNQPSRFIKEIDAAFVSNPLPARGQSAFQPQSPFRPRQQFGGSAQRPPVPFRAAAPIVTRTSAPQPHRADFVPDSPLKMKAGQRVEHERFGLGTIVSLSGGAADLKAIVDFDGSGRKTLLLKFARMKIKN